MAGTVGTRRLGLVLALVLVLMLAGCGGGSGGSTVERVGLPASAASLADSNVALVEVRRGPLANVNMPYVSVTVCLPGSVPDSSTCRTIDDVLLDTGSTGLRLFTSALTGLALPPQTLGSVGTVYECAQFVSTLALGAVHVADVRMGAQRTAFSAGGEHAAALPIQLLDASAALAPNSRCGLAPVLASATDNSRNLQGLGANGILGVSHFRNDGQRYFSCASFAPGCALAGLAADKQVQNPVSRFASGNHNGVVVQLPALPASGAVSAQGYLVFGVETRANNRLGPAQVVPMNASGTFFTTTYQQRAYASSIFDSGSNGVFFDDASIPLCSSPYADFYCPPGTLQLATSVPTLNAAAVALDTTLANASLLFGTGSAGSYFAFNNLSAPVNRPVQASSLSPYFIWGLPAFFGRSVYTLIEGATAQPGSAVLTGPLTAFTP